ncbi:MAG: ATP-binding protein [bacterium]
MSNRKRGDGPEAGLRRRAEAMSRILAAKSPENLEAMSPEETWRLVHDLRVHQIELEMQNEELRRAHAELEIAKSRYFDLFDVAPVGYVVIDEHGLITEVNLTTSSLLGCLRKDLVAQLFTRIIARQDQDIYYLQRKSLFESGTPLSCDLRLLKQDGSSFWAHMEGTVAQNDEGKPVCRAILSDISERKRAEAQHEELQAQLSHSRKIESVGRLAGGVAHDFNNMLAVIQGNVEIALGEVDPEDSLFAVLQDIHMAARRAADVTRQLLAFASKQAVKPEVLDFNEVVSGTLKMLRRLIGEDIQLHWKPDPELWPVLMDPSQLEQILVNLCLNARSAIADVGEISIETGNTTLDESRVSSRPGLLPGDFVRLVVSDNGGGMDEAVSANIFEPFFTTRDVGKGTGLGLATVHGSIIQNGGIIDVDSKPGRGTTFFIYLPRYLGTSGQAASRETAAARETAAPQLCGHETVLVVEDEPSILTMAGAMLKRQGYTVLAAGCPETAIRLAAEYAEPVHLLITDVIMPGMNGRDLAAALLKVRPELKCLFMSGYPADVIAHRGVLEAGRQFIQKPFSREKLLTRVREVLAGGPGPDRNEGELQSF